MTWTIKLYLLLFYAATCSTTRQRDTIYTEDKPYEVINIKVPRRIWNQAVNPTPVLKSPVTIVVPVHVSQEENAVQDDDYTEDEIINENELINETVNETESSTVLNEEIVEEVVSAAPEIANFTESPILEDATTLAPQVTGQVYRFPCSCPDEQCGCCTGAFLDKFQMRACGNISFIPEDFVFDVRLSVNNSTVVRRRVSASDPPPICFNPRRAPFVEVCAEISNIRIRNRNAYACLDINANIGGFQIYSASFRCFGLGQSGVQTGLKPQKPSPGPKPVSLYGNPDDDDDRESLIDTVTGGILGGGDGDGFFGGGDGGFFGGGGGDDDDDGPFGGIGDAIGDFFEEK